MSFWIVGIVGLLISEVCDKMKWVKASTGEIYFVTFAILGILSLHQTLGLGNCLIILLCATVINLYPKIEHKRSMVQFILSLF